MTLPPVIRIFFAIDLPLDTKEQIGSYIAVLKKKAKSNAIRWSKPENLHITLQFLAEIKAIHLPTLIEKVRNSVEGALESHVGFQLGGLTLFPNPYRPRVLVLDITPQDQLVALSQLIGEGIKASSYEIEGRPFRAHLTLGRIKQPQDTNLGFLSMCEAFTSETLYINEVVLFRSEPKPDGSAYTPLERITLTGRGLAANHR